MFLNFARKYGDRKEVDKRGEELLSYEASIMKEVGNTETVHG